MGLNDILKALHQVVLMTERLERTTELARSAHEATQANRERIIRIETILEMAMQRSAAPDIGRIPDRRD